MCFESPYIGLRLGCETVNPVSGLYINDLHGISFKTLAKLSNEETVRAENLFKRLEKNAIEAVKRDFLNLVQKKYSFSDIVSEEKSWGNYGEWHDVGGKCIQMDIVNCKQDNIIMDLSTFAFFTDQSFISTVNVQYNDFSSSTSMEFKVAAGENVFRNKITNRTGKISFWFAFPDVANIRQIDNCSCDCNACYCSDCVQVKFYDVVRPGGTQTLLNWVPFNFKILCRNSYDELICMYERDLAQAVWYQTGIQIMLEILTTKELNPILTNSKEDAERLLALWGGTDTTEFATTANNMYPMNGEYIKSLMPAVIKAKNYLEKSNLKLAPQEPYLNASI